MTARPWPVAKLDARIVAGRVMHGLTSVGAGGVKHGADRMPTSAKRAAGDGLKVDAI